MLNTWIALVFAHVVADFLLQTRELVATKRAPRVFALHIAVVAIASALALGAASPGGWAAVALIALTHAAIDACKISPRLEARAARWPFGALRLFAADQAAHLVMIALAGALWSQAFAAGFWPALVGGAGAGGLLIGFALAGGFWMATRAGDLMLALLMRGFDARRGSHADRAPGQAAENPLPAGASLPGAGAWIGWLERTLVFLFVLLGQFNAIGFVIAAKSILRFQYAREPGVSEIVIIGTLASFGWAIVVALVTHAALVGVAAGGL